MKSQIIFIFHCKMSFLTQSLTQHNHYFHSTVKWASQPLFWNYFEMQISWYLEKCNLHFYLVKTIRSNESLDFKMYYVAKTLAEQAAL